MNTKGDMFHAWRFAEVEKNVISKCTFQELDFLNDYKRAAERLCSVSGLGCFAHHLHNVKLQLVYVYIGH